MKFPKLGIYFVMFLDIFKTFLLFSVTFSLFIVAFGLSFYVLLSKQVCIDILHSTTAYGSRVLNIFKLSIFKIFQFQYLILKKIIYKIAISDSFRLVLKNNDGDVSN